MRDIGEGLFVPQDAISKMFHLYSERFLELNLGRRMFSAPIIKLEGTRVIKVHVLTQDCLAIDSFIESDLALGEVVVNHHPPGTHDNDLADLLRIEPTDMDIGDHFGWIFQVEKNHVVDPVLYKIHALPGDGDGLEPPSQYWIMLRSCGPKFHKASMSARIRPRLRR